MCAGYEKDLENFHYQLIESSTSERNKWNLTNEVRISAKTTTTAYSLENTFNEIITQKTKIAFLLKLKFSKLGEIFESRNSTVDLPMVSKKTPLLLDLLLSLNVLKRFLLLEKSNPWALLPFPHGHCETH